MIGFIGLGNMGAFMAKNLMKGGKKVMVYDVVPKAVDLLKSHGAETASSPADLVKSVDVVISMVPTGQHVLDIYQGPKGILETATSRVLCIDSSTIASDMSQRIYASCAAKGVKFLDAPVSGGVGGAENATLTFMVGGDEDAFKKSVPTLQLMGKNVVHCGKSGMGQAAKICNNMLLAITMIGTSETLNLGKRLGLDPKLLTKIINTSSGRNWSCDTYNPVPGVLPESVASKGYEKGFQIQLVTKDLGLAQVVATSTQSPIPLGSLCHQIYRIMLTMPEYKTKDFAAVYKFFSENKM